MKSIIVILSTLLLTAGVRAEAVAWEQNYDHALEKAKQGKKLVMVDIYTEWCGWCKKLDRDVYKDPRVEEKLAKSFVAVKINPETGSKNAELARAFGTRSYPHIVFTDADGKKVAEIRGYIPADGFLKQLEQIAPASPK